MSAPNEETVTTVDETLDAVKPEETKAADTVIDTKEKEAAEDQRPVSRDDSDKDEVRYLHLHEIQTCLLPMKRSHSRNTLLTAQPRYSGRL